MKIKFKKKFGIGLMILMVSLIFISNSINTQASYSENIEIDMVQDQGYSRIVEIDGYNISYANDNAWHYLFVEAPFDLENKSITIENDEVFHNISEIEVETSFLHSMHENNTLEFKIKRDYIGNTLILTIDTDTFILNLNPASKPYIIYGDDEDDDDETEGKVHKVTIGDWLESETANWTPIHYIFLTALVCFTISGMFFAAWRYKTYEIVSVQKKDKFRTIRLGRFMGEEKSKLLPDYWVHRYKSSLHGIKEYHCTETHSEMESTKLMKILIIAYYPHYIDDTLEIPENKRYYKKVVAKGVHNKCKYYIYRIVCFFIPNNLIAKKLYENVEMVETKELVTEVPLIQFDLTLAQLTLIGDIIYDQWIDHETKGRVKYSEVHKDSKKQPKLILLENKPYWKYLDLQKDKTVIQDTLKFKHKDEMDITKFRDVKKAIEYRNSLQNERSTHELQIRELLDKINELTQDLIDSRASITRMEADYKKRLLKELEKIHLSEPFKIEDFVEALAGKLKAGIGLKDAVKEAYIEAAKRGYFKQNEEESKDKAILEAKLDEKEKENERLRELIRSDGRKKNRIQISSNLGDG